MKLFEKQFDPGEILFTNKCITSLCLVTGQDLELRVRSDDLRWR